MNVIVLAGGDSDEREVSLRSGAAVAAALRQYGHAVTELDPRAGLEDHVATLRQADAVFPALHGSGGEDGVLQSFCEPHGIRLVGSDSRASALCFDKQAYAKLLMDEAIRMPAGTLVDQAGFEASDIRQKPFVLKPNTGGSSVDTFVVRDVNEYDTAAVDRAFAKHTQLLLQTLIEGDEITIAVLNDQPLPVIEIIPPADQEFDYENKYNGATQELCPPVHIPQSVQADAQELASRIHQLTGCRDMSRTDMIVDNIDQLWILETNTIPGLTDQSLLPKAAAQAGISMPELCDRLVRAAASRPTNAGTDVA